MDNQNQAQNDSHRQIITKNSQNLKNQLIDALNIANLPEDKKGKILSKAEDVVFKKILLKVMSTLSEGDKNQFNQLLEESTLSKEGITTFLKEKVPDFEKLVKKEIDDFKAEF